jgi:quercetin dioxygenase-like cupin family protein
MKSTELQELAALDAVGALDVAEQARLEGLVANDPEARREWLSLRATAGAVEWAAPRVPSPGLKSRLLGRIGRTPQLPRPQATAAAVPGFAFVLASDDGWQPTPVPELMVKELSVNRREGYRVVLGRLAPGGSFPRHRHATGPEQMFIVSGDLVTEGRVLRAGDYLHAQPGTDHQPLLSPHGCVALIIEPVEGPVYADA